MEYEEMLARAYEKMPPVVFEKKRFEPPKLKVSIEGNKTIVKNFEEVSSYINRDLKQMLKFIGKEMGAAWRIEGSRVVFVGKFSSMVLEKKFEKYLKEYVICPVCEKPDTKLTRIDRVLVMKCMACGATTPVPQL